MDEGERVLGPNEQIAVFNEKVRDMMTAYCCLTRPDDVGKSIARGTGTFVKRRGTTYVGTAYHVLDEMRGEMRMSTMPLASDGRAVARMAVYSEQVLFTPRSIFESKELDVALLEIPRELASPIGYFDVDDVEDVESWLRANWCTPKINGEETSLPYFALGYPSFGAFSLAELKTEIHSSAPIQGRLTGWDAPGTGRVPQMIAALDAEKPDQIPAGLNDHERAVAEQLFDDSDPERNAFGGYSGGPFVLVTPAKNHLIGFIKQGGRPFGGAPRMYASALADVIRASGI